MLGQEDLEFIAARRARTASPAGRPRSVGLALVIALHLAALALLLRASHERMRADAPRRDDVLIVRLLPPDSLPSFVPSVPARPTDRVRGTMAPVAPSAREVLPAEPTEPVPDARLFNPDGSPMLPREAEQTDAGDAFHLPEAARLPAPGNPVHYKPTRFDPVWVKDREQLGERLVRKTAVVKTFDTNGGTRISCVWSPLYALVAFGCGWGPTPREPAKPAPWLAVAGETRPETPAPIDPQPFD